MATQQDRRKATRAAITDAAFAAFEAHGSPDVALEEIALASGVTKGTIHYHFGTRLGLLEAVATKLFGAIETTALAGETADALDLPRYVRALLEQQALPVGRVLYTIGDELLRAGSLDTIDPYRFLQERLEAADVAGSSAVIAAAVVQFGRQLAFGLADLSEIDAIIDALDL